MKREEVQHAQRRAHMALVAEHALQAEARQSKGALSVRRGRLGRLRCGGKGGMRSALAAGRDATKRGLNDDRTPKLGDQTLAALDITITFAMPDPPTLRLSSLRPAYRAAYFNSIITDLHCTSYNVSEGPTSIAYIGAIRGIIARTFQTCRQSQSCR